jgi:RNA polymerase sigma factor (sigma-70 family)
VNLELTYMPGFVAPEREALPTRRSLLNRLRDLDDHASWQAFFDTYWRLIYNVARKSGLGDAEAQDVVQETVIAVARRMPAFRYDPSKGSFKRWLLVITRRRIQDQLRKIYRSMPPGTSSTSDLGVLEPEATSPTLQPDAQLEKAWEEEWQGHVLQAALLRVRQSANPKHYQVFDYCVLRNLPHSQVARMLGLNLAQVYLAKHRIGLTVRRTAGEVELELTRSAASRQA